MSEDGLPPLRDVITDHGLQAKKTLGQNFLLDLNLTRKIARTAGDLSNCDVLEIGPGPGGLTRALLMEGARKVVAIERDSRCLPALAEIAKAYPGRLEVIEGDALKFDPMTHLNDPIKIVANLPYNVGTELLVRWLNCPDWPPYWTSLTLMFQREVAQRIVATPANNAYGRLAVLANWRTQSRIVFDLPPSAFTPAPKVTSSIVHLKALAAAQFDADVGKLERVTGKAFGQRRKMLRGSLKGLLTDPVAMLSGINIDPTRRAETLSIKEFCAISRLI